MTAVDPSAAPLMSLRSVSKSFGPYEVLRDVSFDVAPGTVVGLLGENGAGKSTVLNLISGQLSHDRGEIEIDGSVDPMRSYRDANGRGIFRVFQEGSLIENLTVYENIFLGWEWRRGYTGVLRRRDMAERIETRLKEIGFPAGLARRTVSSLSSAERQSIEIAKTIILSELLRKGPSLFLFDEPTTALDASLHGMFERIIEHAKSIGSVILVSHNLKEILALCDRVIVMRDGIVTLDRAVKLVDESLLHEAMVGRVTESPMRRREIAGQGQSTTLQIFDPDDPRQALSIAAREIVGVAGLEGSGKHRLALEVAGDKGAMAGRFRIAPRFRSIRSAVRGGFAYLPKDRRDGLIGDDDILETILIPSAHDRFRRWTFGYSRSAAKRAASQVLDKFKVKASAGLGTRMRHLSGGNQQKVMLAKWLLRNPKLLILDNPTQSVDVEARHNIHKFILDASDEGASILVVSNDLRELVSLSDRIVVMNDGRIRSVLDNSGIHDEMNIRIVEHMTA